MEKRKFEDMTNEIWNHGSYLSTRIREQTVINTYAYEGYFFDIEYNVEADKIIAVIMDDLFDLNHCALTGPERFRIHLN